jgi:uncharacterized iron-regulated membrane protein
MRTTTYARWQAVHTWSSLVSTVLLLLLCLTGLPLIFSHEIDHLSGNAIALPEAAAPHARANLDAIVADARARRPGEAVRFATHDDEDPLWFIALGAEPGRGPTTALLTYDARSGALLRDTPLRQGFMWLMVRLHTDLFAGLAGALLLGAMGLLLTAALVSGVVVYGRTMRKLDFGTVRHGRSRRLRWWDLHNLTGIATLVWLLVVGLTGTLLTLAKPVYALWQEQAMHAGAASPAAASAALPTTAAAGVQAVLSTALAHAPGKTVAFIAFPGTRWAPADRYVVFLRGDSAVTARIIEPVFVDAKTARFVAMKAMPGYVFALRISGPLHFGDYGGLPMKLAWAAFDIVAIVVLGSGLYLWWGRRAQARGRHGTPH